MLQVRQETGCLQELSRFKRKKNTRGKGLAKNLAFLVCNFLHESNMRQLIFIFSILFAMINPGLSQEALRATPQAYGESLGVETDRVTENVKPTPEAYNPEYQLIGKPRKEVHDEGKGKVIEGKYKISDVKRVYLDLNISPGPVDPHQRAIYQNQLSQSRYNQYGVRYNIHWGGEGMVLPNLTLVLEVRGLMGDIPTQKTLSVDFTEFRRGSRWTEIEITGEDFQALGQLTAWKASLVSDGQVLAEKRSFLWR